MPGSKLQFPKHRLLAILLFLVSAAATILLCEVVLQFAGFHINSKSYYIQKPHLRIVFKPHQDIMPGVYGTSEFITNSNGIRGDELTPQQTYRILALGGSTTECGYLDQRKAWPDLLQQKLNENSQNERVWIGNAGVSGTTSRHHVIALEYLPLGKLKIDALILLIGINDFSKRLSQDKDYDPHFLEKPEAKKELVAETFRGGNQFLPGDSFYKKTAVWQLLTNARRLLRARANIQDEAGKSYITWREHRRNATEVRNRLPDLASALEEYARNLNKIVDITQEKSIRLILLTQPTMWRSDLPQNLDALLWFGGIGDFQKVSGQPYYSAASLEKGMHEYNATLLRICQERSVESIDLASLLEKDTTVFYDDVHFNESGAQKIAAALSEYMLQRGPFREAEASD